MDIETEGIGIPSQGELEEDRYVSARTHPLIIPSERYVCARTHPPPIKRKSAVTSVGTEPTRDTSHTGTTLSAESGSGTDSGSGMGITSLEMGSSDSGMGTDIKYETGSSTCMNSVPETTDSTTTEPTTVKQETQSVLQAALASVDGSKVRSEVTEDNSPLTSSGDHVFQCGTEVSWVNCNF